jgi:pilus assembly protein Flp/PilA
MNSLRRFLIDDEGVTAIEYGLIAALVAAVLVTAVTLMGTNLSALFTWIAGKLTHP